MSRWDISFKNIEYSIFGSLIHKNKKILNDISGEFRSNELTAIIGSSGSGKSSLLNILSGYQRKNVKGSIELNGIQSSQLIQEFSSYVMQEYTFHKYITVRETLLFRINCKISKQQDESIKNEKIEMILNKIGLIDKEHVYCEKLSGGEIKRLSIAVELLDDPKILFIDECTTGLDSVTSTQCIQLLKNISKEGRTIITSIHQPSALIFNMFDHIYALANGQCIYQGSTESLVPFLSELDLICPHNYNITDFLMEIANNDYGPQNNRLINKVEIRSHRHGVCKNNDSSPIIISALEVQSLRNEISQLLKRNMLNNYRDKTFTIMRILIHLIIAGIIGIIYKGIGKDGSQILNVYKFLFFNIFILMFTAFSSLQTSFPTEYSIVKRENFNKMYTVFSYFIAQNLADIPIIFISNLLYVIISYVMTDQPFEIFRLIYYFFIILLMSFAAQGLGLVAGSFLNEKKEILKNISGEFNGGHINTILGLSGSGKTSLLNVLSGFKKTNVSGKIMINGREIPVDKIRKISSYVMQDQSLHSHLTTCEIVTLSLNLRDKNQLSASERKNKIENLLLKLNIENKRNSLIKDLSGGEIKRLSIAIELVNDPKILFLDEPTTNLDSVSSTHCIELLKKLAIDERKIIVCTIHQPSTLLLKMFDQIYALADGQCIFQGSSLSNIVQFLKELELPCPSTYNPTDFLMEIANNDYGPQNHRLVKKIKNGRNINYKNTELLNNNNKIIYPENNYRNEYLEVQQSSLIKNYHCSYIHQVYYLLTRTYMMISRDSTLLNMRLFIHLVLGLVFGFIYRDVGNKGSAMLDNYRYLVVSVVFLLYTSYYSLFVTFPLEFATIKREHFNNWYSTRAYYTAFILSDVPITIACCIIYVTITYWLTDQPRELYRFLIFLSFTILMSFAAQSLSVMFTALMDLKSATIFGSMLLSPFFLFSGIMILSKDAPEIFSFFFNTNFLDSSLKGVLNSVLGFNRTKLPCDEIFCFLENPKKMLRDFGANIDITKAYYILIIYILISQILAFTFINYRLKYKQT
ncbi:hypothetical protein PVAND_002525 [Polypedilum vanderplanki]|uniref:ABC transporter domain-containing protein n=1 Tax=Polypedilum vanderplanki TaxID=319348 RepID=A0A9J6BRN3_POLVA|nr:hypothetical protein PVAND_002525 [Polypedilum vanderplanki]